MKKKLKFGIVTALLYPLLIYVIIPYCIDHMDIGGSDAAGRGMAKAFAYIYDCIFWCGVVFIISMIVAHKMVRDWWVGLHATLFGLFLSWLGYYISEVWDDYKITPYTEYYYEDHVREEGTRMGSYSRHGKITKYREDGTIESIETYDKDVQNGPFRQLYPNGKLQKEGNMRVQAGGYTSRPDGEWSFYHSDGTPDDKRAYRMGELLKSDKYTLYYDSAKLIRTIVRHELYSGKLDKQGVIGDDPVPNLVTAIIVNGKPEGSYKEYYNLCGKIQLSATATFEKGKLQGMLTTYHENGQVSRTCTYVDNELEGEYITYYADSIVTCPVGSMQYRCNYRKGKRHGTATWFYPNGNPDEEVDYVDGLRHGKDIQYRENGSIKKIYHYQNDKKQGAYEIHNEDGSCEKGVI